MTDNDTSLIPQTPAAAGAAPARNRCENCGLALLGEYCYACGQPVKGLVRHFSSIIGDFADSVLNLDTRLPRTLWPLLTKPGFLTAEYFAGRRVRYVSPVRLFVFISIATFFVAQLMVSFGDGNPLKFGDGRDSFDKAATIEEVEKLRDETLSELALARRESGRAPGAGVGLSMGEAAVRTQAAQRIAELRAEQAAAGRNKTTAPDPGATDSKESAPKERDDDEIKLSFNGRPWDPASNPISVPWLPRFVNGWLNAQVGRAKGNIQRLQEDPDAFKDALLGAIPSTLFILLPVFALMLKILYVFKRRLYMEHLIVALHSHAFLCLALLLVLLAKALQDWLGSGSGVLHSLFGWMQTLLWLWMPIYLLVMQKRVYAQRWLMTLSKYCVLGICYFMLLITGAMFTMLFSLVNM
jgi:hypothetical protein